MDLSDTPLFARGIEVLSRMHDFHEEAFDVYLVFLKCCFRHVAIGVRKAFFFFLRGHTHKHGFVLDDR